LRPACAAALAAATLAAGCGGGDKGGDKAKYVRAGNAICARYSKDIAKLGQPTTLGEIGPYITKAMPIVSRTVGEIAKLDPPGDLKDAYETFRDAAQQTLDRATKLRNAADAGDGEQVRTLLREATAASKRRVGLARAAGLETCAKL
jgi:hypothetical protein